MKLIKEKHRADLKGTKYKTQKIIHAIEFEPYGTFGAISLAEMYLKDLGYTIGIISVKNPIGFIYGDDYISRYDNLNENEKSRLDGLILPKEEFKEGGALIIFFKPPMY